jgi:mannose/fructose-specific phosphotransferase system component IIA
MSDLLRGVIVSHAGVAEAMIAAVESIAGVKGALVPVSNEGCDRDALNRMLTDAVGTGPAVLFVDLPGGSCLTGAASYAHGRADLAVVTGVNLAMLLDFVFHRDQTPAAAAQRAAAAGNRAIRIPAA